MLRRCLTEQYPCQTSFSVVRKIFKKLAKDELAEHLENCGSFLISNFGFRFSCVTVDLLTAVAYRITKTFCMSATT